MKYKKTGCLLGALALAITSVFAHAEPEEVPGTIITKEHVIQDIHGNWHQVSFKVLVGDDGGYTAIVNGRSDNLKAIQEEMCEADGMEDSYDIGHFRFNAEIDNPLTCMKIATTPEEMEEVKRRIEEKYGKRPPEIEKKTEEIIPSAQISSSLYVNDRYAFGTNYLIDSYVNYQTSSDIGGRFSGELKQVGTTCGREMSFYVKANTPGIARLETACRPAQRGTYKVTLNASISDVSTNEPSREVEIY